MSLFSSSTSYLGIDFDPYSVKVVELRNQGGRPRLVTYGYFDNPLDVPAKELSQETVAQFAKLINYVCKQTRVTSTKVVTSLPAFSVFTSILTLPTLAKKDLANAVKWEAKKVIPLPLEEMILDWKVLDSDVGSGIPTGPARSAVPTSTDLPPTSDERHHHGRIAQDKAGKYINVLLTAAPKDLVKRYIDMFRAAGLTLLSVDTESFSLVRSLVGNDTAPVMLVDIGAATTTITIVAGGVPVFNRSLDVGGLTITKAIGTSLSITLDRAEQFKYDIGMNPERLGQGSVPATIQETIAPIIDELKYSINLYRTQGQKPIEKIILTGGSSLLINLPTYISNLLGMKVFLGDPWARVMYPEELKPVLDEIGPRFSVAAGLAMRTIE
jgi:type IV pilus assembly protein PilM